MQEIGKGQIRGSCVVQPQRYGRNKAVNEYKSPEIGS